MVARHPFQENLARAGGADLVLLSPDRAGLAQAVGARLLPTTLGGGNLEGGANLFFDCVGSRSSMQEGLLALRGGGAYVLVGTAAELGPVDLSSLWFRELRLSGSAMYAYGTWQRQRVRTYQLAVDLLARGDYPVQGLVSHVFPLSDYRKAFQVAFDKRRHQSVKVVFDLRELIRHHRGAEPNMKLVISLDVEEEGLFSGQYPRYPGVTNVAALSRLDFIPRDFGLPLTLLVSYRVAQDPAACEILARWRDRHRAEIGVHLHPWSTPPFSEMSLPEPVPPEQLPLPLLRDKFDPPG